MPGVLYLHGFASGPQSSKGLFFRDRFAAQGVEADLPDLAGGDFEHLTLSGQLEVIDRRVRERRPSAVIGSSLGGYLAALYAARHPGAFRALVLLAPGFGFARRWPPTLGEDALRGWSERGWTEIYHYGLGRPCRLSYRIVEDGLFYEDYPNVRDPTLVIHGRRDETVPARYSEEFAARRPNVTLRLLDSDHQLLDVLEEVWRLVEEFLADRTNWSL
jgi:pimeloyl-ACP methyl ester carboxylesterase